MVAALLGAEAFFVGMGYDSRWWYWYMFDLRRGCYAWYLLVVAGAAGWGERLFG